MRLIDADELIAFWEEKITFGECAKWEAQQIIDAINYAPPRVTIDIKDRLDEAYAHGWSDAEAKYHDAVEVVRCRECRNNYGIANDCSFNEDDIVCTYWESDGLTSDDFCSYGKREYRKKRKMQTE